MPHLRRPALRVGFLVVLGVVSLPVVVRAQAPTDSIARRFRFAETFLGADVAGIPAATIGDGLPPVTARALPRLTIGGLHFWGHADFAVTFALPEIARGDDDRSRLTTGIETRGRWYPRPLRVDGVSPFVGGGLGALDLRIGEGPRRYRFQPMAQAGLAVRRGRTLLEAGWSVRPAFTDPYPASRTARVNVSPSPHAFWIGAHRLFETTASLEPLVRRGEIAARTRALREAGRLSGPTLALGVSSPILTGDASFNRRERPWLAPRPRGDAMLDMGVGWYFDRPRMQLNLAWRAAEFATAAYGFAQEQTRRSVAFEAFRTLGDWHGFVPFAGPVVSHERLRVRETDDEARLTDVMHETFAAGVLVGWDIRPTGSERFVLRTNLRWFPRLRVPTDAGERVLDQLEFNFIQVVWHPRR